MRGPHQEDERPAMNHRFQSRSRMLSAPMPWRAADAPAARGGPVLQGRHRNAPAAMAAKRPGIVWRVLLAAGALGEQIVPALIAAHTLLAVACSVSVR